MTRLIVDPLTRVEGHGRVELLLKDGRLDDVVVRLLESPRLFESLVVGRHYEEVPDLVCRICAICSAAHKLTSLQALESAMGINVPPTATILRELLLVGGHIQSHALHLFCLILPDLCGSQDVIALLRQKDPLAQAGLDLKALGNRIQKITGGRVVHPINPVLGGVAYFPPKDELESLAEELLTWQGEWPELASGFLQLSNYPEACPVVGKALATGLPAAFALGGDRLWCGETRDLSAEGYAQFLGEQARADSCAKDAAGEAGPFLTGALARARLAVDRRISFVLPEEVLGIHGNNVAQVHEIGWALKRVGQLLESLLKEDSSESLRAGEVITHGGSGTAVIEAPRGLLVHHYVVDERGTVVAADVVTPTAINQRVMSAQIMADLADEKDHTRLQNVSERIIRAYDPCISCAVHLLTVEDCVK